MSNSREPSSRLSGRASFVRAAEDLNVSQTTVSARIRSLEEQLRRPLFLRSRHGVSLTPAGEQFLRYAPDIVQLWQRARQQVTVPRGRRALLTIGTELGLWHPWLVEWLRFFMRRTVPDVALRARIDPAEALVDEVAAGTLDLAVAYAPRHLPGVRVELLMEERLILATSAADGTVDPDTYVQVDWGHDFAARFDPGLPGDVDPGSSSTSARSRSPTSSRPAARATSATAPPPRTSPPAGSTPSPAPRASRTRSTPCARPEPPTTSSSTPSRPSATPPTATACPADAKVVGFATAPM